MKCSETYDAFFEPGEVTEIRAFGLSRTNAAWEGFASGEGIVSGYFDNATDFGRCAESLDKAEARGIYFTVNPIIPDLLARSVNKLKSGNQIGSTTADKNILCIRWLLIDIDASYPHEIKVSATKEEVQETLKVRDRIAEFMEVECEFAPPIRAMSGNGSHLCFRLRDFKIKDKENIYEDSTVRWLKQSLKTLQEKFGNDKVDIDQKVFNPSRIWRLYGTVSRKADHTEERPHRRSYIEE